jgi:hypothetical protein
MSRLQQRWYYTVYTLYALYALLHSLPNVSRTTTIYPGGQITIVTSISKPDNPATSLSRDSRRGKDLGFRHDFSVASLGENWHLF